MHNIFKRLDLLAQMSQQASLSCCGKLVDLWRSSAMLGKKGAFTSCLWASQRQPPLSYELFLELFQLMLKNIF